MPTTPFDDNLLEVKAPVPRQKRRYAWVVLALILLLVLAAALFMSAQARFNRDYEEALRLLQQQNNIAATLSTTK